MRTVVVCGSKRYKNEIAVFCAKLTELGAVVFEPSISSPIPETAEIGSPYITSKVFKGLTLEHFDWVRKADVCFIFNQEGYTGTSVTMEMAYATALGKPVYALSAKTGDPCRDSLIDKVAATPKDLIRLLR